MTNVTSLRPGKESGPGVPAPQAVAHDARRPVSAANTTERGVATTSTAWWGQIVSDAETAPELQWPRSVVVFDRMRRQESQVKSVLRAVKMPVLRADWLLDPGAAEQPVVDFVAANLGLQVKGQDPVQLPRTRDRFSFRKHLSFALQYLDFGHMFFEQVYRYDPATGLFQLRKLGPRPPRTIAGINVAPDGGLQSITQWLPNGGGQADAIPVSCLVAYVSEPEVDPWLGLSMLRPAYKNWAIKDQLLRIQAQTIHRNGMGIPLYEGADAEANLEPGRKMAESWRAGDVAGGAIPHGAKMSLVGVTGQLPDAEPVVRYHDEQIARAVLAHFLNLGTQTGSWALGSTFADFFSLSLQAVADDLADTATQHIVEDLVDINFGTDVPAPRIVCAPIGSKRDATADAIKTLVDAGVLATDEDLERFVRSVYGLPAPGGTATNTTPPAGGTP